MIKIFHKIYLAIIFGCSFLWEVLVANLKVAYDVITPQSHARPGVIAIPLDCTNNLEITLLTIVMSLTPGTLALDISSDRKKLYIHGMFIKDKSKFIAEIKRKFEAPIIRILSWQ